MFDCFSKKQVECKECGCLLKRSTARGKINICDEKFVSWYSGYIFENGLQAKNVHLCKEHYPQADFLYKGKPISVSESDNGLSFEVSE